MAADVQVLPTNQILNQLDPCKDLAEGSVINQTAHGAAIRPLLQGLFVPRGQGWPWGDTVIGDTKSTIESNLPRDYSDWIANRVNSMQILRASHSTGHSQRPQGLYVSQDSGSPEVVANPKLIVTPGNILDPAGKTKKGATFVVDRFGTLPFANIQRLGLDTVITGPILMTHSGEAPLSGSYTVTIPTNLEDDPITGIFDARTFKATVASAYFKGNETKNTYIKQFAEGKAGYTELDSKKYILCKELGDTLEVEWLNVLIGTPPYTRDNIVIITCDTVVFWRCIINGISVIFTKNGKTQYYGSRQVDAAQRAAIEAAFILSIRKEVITHNQAVIDTLQGVINSPYDSSKPWIDGLTWTSVQRTNCVEYLKKVKSNLENMNKDIDLYFTPLTNLEAAKALADRSHFQNPFVWYPYPGGPYFKVIKKVKYLVGIDKYGFPPIRPSSFSNSKLNQAGGQRGGVTTRSQRRETARAMATIQDPSEWEKIITEIYNERDQDKEGYVIDTSILGASINTRPVGFQGDISNYDLTVWSANAGLGSNTLDRTPYFLYLYIRDYHPEIFTYAIQVSAAVPSYPSISPEVEHYSIDYTIRENDTFNITNVADGVPTADELKDTTLLSIAFAMKFLDAFPSLQTESLMDFLRLFKTTGSTSFGAALPVLDTTGWEREMGGGGEVRTSGGWEEILSDAMDLYELYYAYKIRAVYQDRDLTRKELDLLYGTQEMPRTPLKQNTKSISTKLAPKRQTAHGTPATKGVRQSYQNLPAKVLFSFGGNRYRKTRKQKKPKTKRHRSTKRIRRSQK